MDPAPRPGPPEPLKTQPRPAGKRTLADRLRELEARGNVPEPAPEPEPGAPPPTDAEALATLQAAFPGATLETSHN